MKKYLIIIATVLIIAGCGKEADASKIRMKEGVSYLNGKIFSGKIIDHYPSGKIRMKINMKNGKSDGESIIYYESGKIEFKAKYKKGIPEGDMITYSEEGKILTKVTYENGQIVVGKKPETEKKKKFLFF